MRLTEAKYQGDEQIVVLIDDLPYSDIFDIPVEKAGPPLIDKRTGVVILSYDLLDYSRYAEPNTMPYEQAKHHFPWQAELAGTEKQILTFIHMYFPTWSTDKSLRDHITTMWDHPHVARAAAAAEKSGAIIENDANKQVSRILEAKYAKDYTAFEAFERYEQLMKEQKFFGDIVLEDREYGEANDTCYAQMWGWALECENKEQAKQKAAHFAREIDVPYTGIEIDDHPEPFGKAGVFVTWIYAQNCPNVDQHYHDPLHEARYYRHMSASEVYDRMDDILDYTKHEVDTPVVSVIDFGLGSVNSSMDDAPEVAYVELLVKTTNKERAKQLASDFLNSKDIPHEYSQVEYANNEETYVHAQWVDPITEAQYARPREFTDADLQQVGQLYKKHETLAATGADPFIQVARRLHGDRIFAQLEIWHDSDSWRQEDAERDAIAYMKANRLPYNHYRFREFPQLNRYISKFRFGHPYDDHKPIQ